MVEVPFPNSTKIEDLCAFSVLVDEIPECNELTFSASGNRWYTPTTLIFLAKTCRSRWRKYDMEGMIYTGLEGLSYANNLGFSDALNLIGKPFPKNAFGGENYFPMSQLTREQIERLAIENSVEFGDAIQFICDDIARVVSRNISKKLLETIANSFREIFRNSFEHAKVDAVGYCVQYWPARKMVEICISDRGIGIAKSLEENKYLGHPKKREALYLSLMPGVSSKAWRHKKKKSHLKSTWDNSGYGLFFTHQLFGKLGHFFIASGDIGIVIRNGKPIEDLDCRVEGTIISLSLDLSNECKISAVLSEISELAFRLKEKIGTRSIEFSSVEAFLKKE